MAGDQESSSLEGIEYVSNLKPIATPAFQRVWFCANLYRIDGGETDPTARTTTIKISTLKKLNENRRIARSVDFQTLWNAFGLGRRNWPFFADTTA